MPKSRRRPPRQVSDLSRLVVPVGAGLALVACVFGFVHFTQTALYAQAHFAPGAEHPDDGYAVGLLFLGMAALATLLLSLREPPPMRWRRARSAPPRRNGSSVRARGRAKRARRGTILLP